jgi:hypothetical protein
MDANNLRSITSILNEMEEILRRRIPSLRITIEVYRVGLNNRIVAKISSDVAPIKLAAVEYIRLEYTDKKIEVLYKYLIVKVLNTVDSTYSLDEDTYRKILNLQDICLQHYARQEKIKILLKSRETF